MAATKLALLESRLKTLESEAAQLKAQTDLNGASSGDWVDQIYGLFADYPDFDEVVRLGRNTANLTPATCEEKTSKVAKRRTR